MTLAGALLVTAVLVTAPQFAATPLRAEAPTTEAQPQVTVSTLGGQLAVASSAQPALDRSGSWSELLGEVYEGRLIAWTSTEVVLETEDGDDPVRVPLEQVVNVRFSTGPDVTETESDPFRVEVADGSQLQCDGLTLDGSTATLQSNSLGTLSVPRSAIRNARFAPLGELAAEWSELTQRVERRDFLVIRKEKEVGEGDQKRLVPTLDHLQGTIGGIDDEFIQFLLDGNEIPVKREKVFGICLAQREAQFEHKFEVHTAGGDRLACQTLAIEEDQAVIRTGTGASVRIPLAQLQLINYGENRFVYLSALEPRTVEYTPYFDFTMPYRRDRYNYRLPLRLEGKRYARGLFLHSGTRLVYRLSGEFRRFQTVAGIDQEAGGGGNLDLTISGDGRELFKSRITGRDAVRILDLDVSGVRDLEILVEFGEDMGTLDHLDLADARLIR